MELTVSGKQVVLRERITAREGWALRGLAQRAMQGERLGFDEECQALAYVVESWEFDGDPTDPAAYEALDATDFIAIDQAVGQQLLTLFGTSKN